MTRLQAPQTWKSDSVLLRAFRSLLTEKAHTTAVQIFKKTSRSFEMNYSRFSISFLIHLFVTRTATDDVACLCAPSDPVFDDLAKSAATLVICCGACRPLPPLTNHPIYYPMVMSLPLTTSR